MAILNLTTGIVFLKSVSGAITISGAVTADSLTATTGDIVAPSSRFIYWNSRTALSSSADGRLSVTNQAGTAGVGLDIATDAVFKIRNRSFTAGTGSLDVGATVTNYNNAATAGTGVTVVRAQANISGQTTNATITSYANPATDADYYVSGQMSVTASTTLATTITCTYTDVSNTARTMVMPVQPLSGTFTAAGAISGAGASIWETPVMHIRAKASTTITLLTSAGTFTGVTYSASGVIAQLS